MLFKRLRNLINDGNSRSVTVKKNIIATLGLRGISILVSFLLVPATIGYVSSELYGVWLTLSSVLTWLHFFDVGLTQGLKNKLTEAIAHEDWFRARSLVSTTYFLMIVIFVPLSIIGYIAVPWVDWASLLNISSSYTIQIIRVMRVLVFFVALQMIVNVIVSVIAAFQKVALSQSFLVIGNILAFLGIVLLTHTLPPSLVSLAFVLAGSPIFVTIIGSIILFSYKMRQVSPTISSIRLSLVKDLFGLGIKFFIINVQVVVVFQTTNLLISHVSSPESVTAYNIAYKYLGLAMMVYTNVTLPLWPAYTDAYTKGDYAWMKNMRHKMNKILGLCALCCIFLAIISQPVYQIWIEGRANVPNEMTWFVTAYVIIYCYMNLNGTFIVGMGKVHLDSIVVTIGMIIYIPMALFLARYLKQYGILLALILLNLAYAIIFHIQTNLLLNQKARGIWNK